MRNLNVNGTELLVVADYDEMSKTAADMTDKLVLEHPTMSLLVPTGTSPEGWYAKADIKYNNATFFNMDEYCEPKPDGSYAFLPPDSEVSYHRYMREHLFGRLVTARSFFPGIENIEYPGTYDKVIAEKGGIDLCLNAIGEDGHTFGFNLPGRSPVWSVTRLMQINPETQSVNKKLTGLETPNFAVTIGLRTGMMAKEIITLVSGERKADILREVLVGDITDALPATVLRTHTNNHWIIDEAAASKLR